MSDTESDIEDIPHDEIVKKLKVPEFDESPTSSGGEEDDESSEPERDPKRGAGRRSGTPSEKRPTSGEKTPVDTDAEQRSRSQIAITLPASKGTKASSADKSLKSKDKKGKSTDDEKEDKLLHPGRAESRSSGSRKQSKSRHHDTSGTSGSDTGVSDGEDPDGRAVTFKVEYKGSSKVAGKQRQMVPAPRRPEIVVSNVQDVGRGGIINTHGQPARFLPSKSKSSHRTSGRSRRLRQSSASSRSPSQSGEDYYTTDDEGQRRKHRSKSRKDERKKSSKKKSESDSRKHKERDSSRRKKLRAVRFFTPGDEKKILKILDAKKSRLYGKQSSELNIDIQSVQQFSYEDELRAEEYAPPDNLSPRSAAKYVKHALKKAAKERKALKKAKKQAKKKDKAESADEKEAKEKKKQKPKKESKDKSRKSKGRRKRRRRRRKIADFTTTDDEDSDIEVKRQSRKPTAKLDSQFYPNLRQQLKKKWVSEAKPVTCSICQNVHYRTKLNFAANLKIIVKVNNALGSILMDMRKRMTKIEGNLDRVGRNIEHMEDMYEDVFRKINRLISNETHVNAIISFAKES